MEKESIENELLIFICINVKRLDIMISKTTKEMIANDRNGEIIKNEKQFTEYLKNLHDDQTEIFLEKKKSLNNRGKIATSKLRNSLFLNSALFSSVKLNTRAGCEKARTVLSGTGVIITIILVLIPISAAIVLMFFKLRGV